MRKILTILALLFVTGCAVTTETPRTRVKDLTNLEGVAVGMSQKEVESLMGGEVVVGYELSDDKSGTFTPITVKNPVRRESVMALGKDLDVAFYFTRIKQPDGQITDDELTPMVFEKGKLIGRGWQFLNDTKKTP